MPKKKKLNSQLLNIKLWVKFLILSHGNNIIVKKNITKVKFRDDK